MRRHVALGRAEGRMLCTDGIAIGVWQFGTGHLGLCGLLLNFKVLLIRGCGSRVLVILAHGVLGVGCAISKEGLGIGQHFQ